MNLLKKITVNSVIEYSERKYRVLGKVIYATQNDPSSIYVKILLEGHHVLVIVPADKIAYFGENVGELSEFNLFPQNVKFRDRQYTQVNSDYQIVLGIEFGSPLEVEGEVEFWDYEADDEIISIAVVSRNKTRADVVAKYISFNDINILS